MTIDPNISAQYMSLTDEELDEALEYANVEIDRRAKIIRQNVATFSQAILSLGAIDLDMLVNILVNQYSVKFQKMVVTPQIYVQTVLADDGGFLFSYGSMGQCVVSINKSTNTQTSFYSQNWPSFAGNSASFNQPSNRAPAPAYTASTIDRVSVQGSVQSQPKRAEKPCSAPSCGKMNDLGVTSCWCCGGKI